MRLITTAVRWHFNFKGLLFHKLHMFLIFWHGEALILLFVHCDSGNYGCVSVSIQNSAVLKNNMAGSNGGGIWIDTANR